MNENIVIALISAFGGYLGNILVARLSKSKHEKAIDVAGGSLKLVDMTMDQLERKINEIDELQKDVGKLERDNRRLSIELVDYNTRRKKRDEAFDALEAHVEEMREKLGEMGTRNRVLWQYLIAWMEHAVKNELSTLDPPDELKSDPEIMRILGRKNNHQKSG